ncbi:MAG: hypothetical protein FJ023_00015 [Chloroflexi bacterium]|nr:hypothetical protein [Chloroflexota bacterium]
MKLSGFRWVRSMNSILGLCLCLVLIGLTTAGAIVYTNRSYTGRMLPDVQVCKAEPLQQNEADYTSTAIDGNGPVIQVFKADPMELDTPTSAAVYTFKVRRATNVVINEAGTNIKNISNPSGAALNGTADGLPASAITTDDSGKFITILMASNEYGSDTAELTLSLAANLIPAGQSGPTDNQTEQRTPKWLDQYSTPGTSPPSITTRNRPDFFKCPSNCAYCLKPGEAANLGFTQKCSDARCYYSPDDQQNWYCYSEPEGWCCANEKVSQTTKRECTQIGGFWSTFQAEAIEFCQPKGYCCLNGQIYYPSTQAQCVQMGGSNWSTNRAQTMERCQPMGYCCRDGQVYTATQAQCTQVGGSYWSTNQAQVTERCQPPTCWCCLKSQVYQTTQAQCTQTGGACYATQSQAAAACRQTPALR